MKRHKLVIWPVLILLVGLAACQQSTAPEGTVPAPEPTGGAPPSASRSAGGVTARKALEKARQQAQAWQADARLEKVSTIYANREGKVSTESVMDLVFPWSFIFSSESAQKAIEINTNGEKIKQSDAPGWSLFRPIGDEFIDSDQAMAEAIRNGYVPQDATNMELVIQHGTKQFTEPTWVVGQIGAEWYYVSAKTGKFVEKVTE